MRPHNKIFVWWEDPVDTQFWVGNTSWAIYYTDRAAFEAVLRDGKQSDLRMHTMSWISCNFDETVVTPENAHLQDRHVPFKVRMGGFGHPDKVDHLSTYSLVLTKMLEVCEWLEGDPVIGRLSVSQHRWNIVANVVGDKAARDDKAAREKMDDPGFTRSEAAALMDRMHDLATCGRRAQAHLYGREGTSRGGCVYTLEADSTSVRSTGYGGGWTDRVTWSRGDYQIKKSVVLKELQEEFSAAKNSNWREDLI